MYSIESVSWLSSKFLTGLAAFLTSSFLITVFFFSQRALDEARQVNQYHIPILQLNAISVRLTESLSSQLLLAAETKDPEWVEQFLLTREALAQNLEDLQDLSRDYETIYKDLQPFKHEDWNRTTLSTAEDQIIALILSGKREQALNQIKSKLFQDEQAEFRDRIQSFAETVATERDSLLSSGAHRLEENLYYSIGLLIATILIWLLSLTKFKQDDLAKKAAREELERERTKSFQTAKLASLGEMAGGIAHEINNPLAIISGYARRLQSLVEKPNESREKIVRYAEKIEQTGYRMAKIVNSLRRLSRNSFNEHFEESSIRTIVEDVLEISNQRFKANQVSLTYPQPLPEIMIRCRNVQISQVVLNLLNNAYDACVGSEGASVTIEIEEQRDQIKIRVVDSGPGVPPEVEARLFEPFFTTKGIGHGTGLGLSISKAIVDEHNGKLQVYRRDSFTVFEIELWKDPELQSGYSDDLPQMSEQR